MMRVHLYYPPYPCQKFEDDDLPISPVRVRNPKSALPTLVAGVRRYLEAWQIEADIRIFDTQLNGGPTHYKTIDYGPRKLQCFRFGRAFEEYDTQIGHAQIHGISNNFTNSSRIAVDLVQHIKMVNPKALVVAGGVDVSARPEFYIDNGVDIVVQLEGEYIFAKVIEAYARGQHVSELIPCRKYKNGFIIKSKQVLDMNCLQPMSLDLIDNLAAYTDTGEGPPPATVKPPFLCFETSRGCYQGCSFCATPFRGKYRFMSYDTVAGHFEYFKSMGVNNLLFQEDNLLSRIHRSGTRKLIHDSGRSEIIAIFRLARDYGFSWEFANGIEFGKFLDIGKLDEELMEALFWSNKSGNRWQGCYRVQISLENLGPQENRKLNKLRTYNEELEILKCISDLGVNYQTFNVIIGHNGDDDNILDYYLKRCLTLKNDLIQYKSEIGPYFNVYNRSLLPGSKDYRQNPDQLAFNIDLDPEVVCLYLSSMNTNKLSYYDLFLKRLQMSARVNGEMIHHYDGIHNAL